MFERSSATMQGDKEVIENTKFKQEILIFATEDVYNKNNMSIKAKVTQ